MLLTTGTFELTKDLAVMIFFAIIMLLAAISMIHSAKAKNMNSQPEKEPEFNFPLIMLEGIVIGVLTGLVGAGGGFLIIPALVLLAKLPMKLAIGTSLLIIAAKSLIGFIGDIGNQPIDWSFLGMFTTVAVAGIFLGAFAGRFIPSGRLKSGFGWFVLVMAVYIIARELLF